MDWKQKKVLVFGTGISGIGSADLLEKVGALPILYDGNENIKEEEVRGRLAPNSNAQIIIGELNDEVIDTLDLAVLSPGVPTDLPVVNLSLIHI